MAGGSTFSANFNSVTVFEESKSGAWTAIQTLNLLSPEFEGRSTPAEIAMHPNGRYL
jgi:6-phosphogluconolactonase (cycloisomerase 2 family)